MPHWHTVSWSPLFFKQPSISILCISNFIIPIRIYLFIFNICAMVFWDKSAVYIAIYKLHLWDRDGILRTGFSLCTLASFPLLWIRSQYSRVGKELRLDGPRSVVLLGGCFIHCLFCWRGVWQPSRYFTPSQTQ